MPDYAAQREQMVQRQIARRGIIDPRVLEAMRRVPREQFVDAQIRDFAYADSPLPIAHGQTISQPYIVALMLEAAQLSPVDRALEIGAGSGYAAAVMAAIAAQVFAIERHPELVERARERYARMGYDNITLRSGDGSGGWPGHAAFDAIIVAAGAPSVPAVLRNNCRSEAGWCCRWATRPGGSGCCGSPAPVRTPTRKASWATCCSCRWSANMAGPRPTMTRPWRAAQVRPLPAHRARRWTTTPPRMRGGRACRAAATRARAGSRSPRAIPPLVANRTRPCPCRG